MTTREDPRKQFEGKIQHHGRFAFLLAEPPAKEDVMLRGPSLRLAMDGDRVRVRLLAGEKGRPVGEIVQVLERSRSSVTGVLKKAGSGWIAVPEESDERDAVEVLTFAAGAAPQEGHVALVKITRWPTMKDGAGGEAVEVLGSPADPGVRVKAVLHSRELPDKFPEEVLSESRSFPDSVSPEMYRGRIDLRNIPVFTIDGADAKDFDDAVSLETVNPHIMRLGVHIADVSRYVKKGTAIDKEAAERATSVYLADRVVPMLPPNLSDHLCSLMPDVERLTLSCFLDMDDRGNVRSSVFKETVIRSRRRFTYEEVEDILQGKKVERVDPETNEAVLKMGTLYKAVHLKRLRRGALDMTMPEYKVVVDAEGRPLEVVKRPRLGSHRLIEEFMLLANEAVAAELLHRRIPFLSRIHPDPDKRKLEGLGAELKKMGAYAPSSLMNAPTSALQIILGKAVGHPLEDAINMVVVRSLKQASYSSIAGPHFGLASKAYCHFTSPIRRYPDLITHRAVKALIHERKAEHAAEELHKLGEHCSERERLAADAERKSVDILRAELLKKKVGQTFEGTVTGTAGFGVFVTLKDFGATGLVRGHGAPLGSRIGVRLDRVDEGKGELDLSALAAFKPRLAEGESAPAGKPGQPPAQPERKPWQKPQDRGGKPWRKPQDRGSKPWRKPEDRDKKPWQKPEDRDRKPWQKPGQPDRKPWQKPGDSDRKPWQKPDKRDHKPWQRPDQRDRKPWQKPGEGDRKPWQKPGEGDRKPWQKPGQPDRKPWQKKAEGGGEQKPWSKPGGKKPSWGKKPKFDPNPKHKVFGKFTPRRKTR